MRSSVFLFCLCLMLMKAFAEGTPATTTPPLNRSLKIDPSSMSVAAGKATLKIGTLRRTNDVFGGPFEMKVTPYFFKNDKGSLAISINDDCIVKAAQGLKVDITGTATSADSKGDPVVRHINAVATPVDADHGKLKLWFTIDDRKMVFETIYRFIAE